MTKKLPTLFAAFFLCAILCLVWSHAQSENSNLTPSNQSNTESGDKWKQVIDNNKNMEQTLSEIEQNLQFIKARSMSGGRNQ